MEAKISLGSYRNGVSIEAMVKFYGKSSGNMVIHAYRITRHLEIFD
jgi:hypothetical protein